MSAIIVLILLDTIGELIFCKFSLWFIISAICRVLFCLRCFGIIFKTKPIFVGEAIALGCMIVWYLVARKDAIPWLNILLTLLFTGIAVGLEWLDGLLYVYEVLDEDEL